MARWQVTVMGKGVKKASVEKLAAKIREEFGEGTTVHVADATPPTSRADRFSAAQSGAEEAKSEMESLQSELQDWFDNLPENFQSGDKGQQLEEAISALQEQIDNLDTVCGAEVNFPAMMG